MPQLVDPHFQRTVVLMIEHGESGSLGLVINRPTGLTFADLSRGQELKVSPHREADLVFQGGPVEPHRGFVLHDSGTVEEKVQLVPGLFLSVTTDALEPLLLDDVASLRFCLGYAGWGPGQVERELQQGSWLFTEASKDTVLVTQAEEVWAQAIKSMGVDPAMLVSSGGVN